MERQAEYGAKQDFKVEVLSRGSCIDRDGGKVFQIDTFTLRLNHVALNEYLLSEMMNSRKCYSNDELGMALWRDHRIKMVARRKTWKAKMLEALRIGPSDSSMVIKQIQAEFFGAVWIRDVT